MGIQGIYKEIGPGLRTSFARLAAQKFQETGRPFRIAVDTSIWLFQIQASKGGTNPALRTFYYRILRLISLSIHPLFVFDGRHKPPVKRNKRTGLNVASIPEFLAKQLLNHFGIPIHQAPGEAEAECALLQREGVVDAVVSEDVDTLMFGSGLTLRNWSPESKTSKIVTHVNAYHASKTQEVSGLDREGLILVALMSGGDYNPDGIPGCGPKIACEAARAGFGRELCQICTRDSVALVKWRERLQHELHTNESKLFKTKHAAVMLPEDFPKPELIRWYKSPTISGPEKVQELRQSLRWDTQIDFPGLRKFTGDAFQWTDLGGAKKFIRNLAPALVVRDLRLRGSALENGDGDRSRSEKPMDLIRGIHGKRNHASTDYLKELRVSFLPADIVNIDLSLENPDPVIGSEQDVEEEEFSVIEEDDGANTQASKQPRVFTYEPSNLEKMWVLDTFVRLGAPTQHRQWEDRDAQKESKKAAATSRKAKGQKSQPSKATDQGAIDQFMKVTKPGVSSRQISKPANDDGKAAVTIGGLGEVETVSLTMAVEPTTPRKNAQPTIIDLLSSPPCSGTSQAFRVPGATQHAVPSKVISQPRKRQGPIRRTQTLPTNLTASETRHASSVPLSQLSEGLAAGKVRNTAFSPQSESGTARSKLKRSTTHASSSAMRQWLQPSAPLSDAPSAVHGRSNPFKDAIVEELDLTESPVRPTKKPFAIRDSTTTRLDAAREHSALPCHPMFARASSKPAQPLLPVSGNASDAGCSAESLPETPTREMVVPSAVEATRAPSIDAQKPPRRNDDAQRSALGQLSRASSAAVKAGRSWAGLNIEVVDLVD